MVMLLSSLFPRRHRIALRSKVNQIRRLYVERFRSYGPPQLADALCKIGVQRGDTVVLHSAFEPVHGFEGTIEDLTNVFLEAVGPEGNLLMVSLPYRTSSLEYLSKAKP